MDCRITFRHPQTRFKHLNSSPYIDRMLAYKTFEADGISATHLLWHRILGQYTASGLTVPSDKLIACSSVSRRLAGCINQDEYVASMWPQYLEGELLWVTVNTRPGRPRVVGLDQNSHRLCTRARVYRPPTWSWASIDGPVEAGEPRKTNSQIVVEDYLDYCTSDKTGGIRGGWIQLRGIL